MVPQLYKGAGTGRFWAERRMRRGIHFLFGQKENAESFDKILERFSGLGFDCLEVPPDCFLERRDELREFKKKAEEKGVEIIFNCSFPPDCDMASQEKHIREQGKEYLKSILGLMAEEEIGLLNGICYTKWPAYRTEVLPMAEKERILERAAGCLRKAAEEIKGTKIEIALEPLNRFEGYLINTAQEGVKFCEMIENPQIGLLLDGFHMSMEENSIEEAVRTAGPYLKHLHLAENNRNLPGTGTFPWERFFYMLKEISYQGRLDIEAFITAGGSVSASVGLWRELDAGASREEQDRMLCKALRFIDEKCRECEL